MNNWLKRALGMLLALCLMAGAMPAALAADRSELESHWASEYLTYFADEGYLLGDANGSYRPNSNITRAEFITLINRICEFTERDDETAKMYTDISEDKWYFEAVSIGLKAGYINGTSETTMSPNSQITRQDAFTIISRISGIASDDTSVLAQFSDGSTVRDYAQSAVAGLIAGGYVNGYENGTVQPKKHIKRCEAVKVLSVCLPKLAPYTYLYAPLTYNEYWAGEDVYAAGNTDSSDVLDGHSEYDKGGFDAVSRATKNHGLHRGSFQQTAYIDCEDGTQLAISYWKDSSTIVLTDGSEVTFKKGDITLADGTSLTMKDYTVTGIKYVPVAVLTKDLEAFQQSYAVVMNGEKLVGGYGEGNLSSYEKVAEVTAATNGLKYARKNGDGTWSFSARQTGTDSGIQGEALAAAENVENTVKEYDGNYGEFLRMDITGDGYGALGAAMQTVKWTYYGNDSTYTTPVISYGTKFAADNWMHKAMGIQLGLTDSIRCQLPEGYTGEGYWTVTVYALGYADYTAKIQVTADNLPKETTPITDDQKAQLTALKDQAEALLAGYDAASASDALKALKEHYDEAVAMLADPDATSTAADELLAELPQLIENAKPKATVYTGSATAVTDDPESWSTYDLTAEISVTEGTITEITVSGGGTDNAPYIKKVVKGVVPQLTGKTLEEAQALEQIDAATGATVSSRALLEAVKSARPAA